MPDAAVRPCIEPGCGEYAVRNGRCAEHAPKVDQRRGKTAARGYDADWKRVRAMKLQRDPFCQLELLCGKGAGQSEPAVATEVDHRIPISIRPDLRLAWSNLQSACKPCNSAKGDRYPG